MDRAFRILTIYNRLLQNKEVNKKSLTLELNTSPRTIQRDIDDIRNFLYESKNWMGAENEISYDYKYESYRLSNNKVENVHFMYELLASLFVTSPTLNPSFYQYLKSLIMELYPNNQKSLLKYLNKFTVDEFKNQITPLASSIKALNENKYLEYNQKLIIPLSIFYQLNTFYLVYQMGNEAYINDINKMNLRITDKDVNIKQMPNIQTYITLEVSKDIWLKIHKYYRAQVIEKLDEFTLIATFKMTKLEAIQLCFMYRSNIRIISPPDLKDQVIDELLTLQSTYLKQHIQK
ncbi:HTH domain-containing protein [Mammaliicoccus sciuri]|uniref:HTH domain-containing protein n=2 Tax=Mammaliicoccus sciuri TaxID=1296 RepID=A0AAJ4VGR6_MAMSC|nr:HTH domain-containing protein [Mammaliicoccus sciuri]RTX70533.1 HTH domain-containing protein [Mammaliicoccus sciuri]